MTIIFEISTTHYDDDITIIKKSMINIESICGVGNGFNLGKPIAKFGWTFFQLAVSPYLMQEIEKKFVDMIKRYRGHPDEKFSKFLVDYFDSKGCSVRIKSIDT